MTKRLTPSILVIAALQLSCAAALAADRTPEQLRQQLTTASGNTRMACYQRTLANGARRVYFDPCSAQHLRVVEGVLHARGNTLEICHIGAPNANHTLGLYNRQLLHVQYRQGTSNWRLRSWGNALRPSARKLYSAVIQLSASEAQRLTDQLQQGIQAQGPENQAGANWERGNLRNASNRSFNCVSYWSEMPVGDHGEPLWRLLGLRSSYNGNPKGLQRALETEANDKVAGICAYGPQVQGFGQDVGRDLFTF